ncbi:MAG: circularly permuted type 2 ATP-grasp protein, partial [bacterium]|nr:circularly permuted type 2 ATP-grasp protein [bacterium]
LRMVESNTEIPGGNEESYFLEQEYLKIFEPEGLKSVARMEIVFDTLMTYYRIQAEHKGMQVKSRLNICLAQRQSEIDRILGEYEILIDYVKQRGHNCSVVDPTEISIKDGRAYDPSGERIDLIYRRFTSDELPIVSEKKWQLAWDWDQARVAVVNPFCTKRVDSKNIMVLFRDEAYEDVFPAELKQDLTTVRAVIPWTKKIKQRLVLADGREVEARPYLLENRESLVIKHANAYSSSAVFLGEDADDKGWQEIVDRALGGDWIVQEKIELPEIEVEYWENDALHRINCIYNVSPYIYDGELGGLLNRASTDKLTAFKPGSVATIMPCFERVEQ